MPPKTREQRLFGAACLKLALERGAGDPRGSEIYRDTLRDLDLSEPEVDAYLDANRGSVQAALDARGKGKAPGGGAN